MSAKRPIGEDPKSEVGSQARSYPRKRVSIACEVCRLRKTRCDAAKPACSFCAELGIECVYKRPADATRPEPRSEDLSGTIKRLDRIEWSLDAIAQKIGVPVEALQMNDSFQQAPASADTTSPFVGTPLAFRSDPGTHSPGSGSTSSKRRYACKMPNLLKFRHPYPEGSHLSYNCTEGYFEAQMDDIADIQRHISSHLPKPDLSKQRLTRYQQAFEQNALRWLPLFGYDVAAQHLEYVNKTQHQTFSTSLCLVYLIYAIGAISDDRELYYPEAPDIPGFVYYAHAARMLSQMPSPTKDLTVLQCRILATIFLLFAMRPLQAWSTINQCCQECIIVLRCIPSIKIEDTSPFGPIPVAREHSNTFYESFNRIYWISYVLENELEACLEVPSSGIRTYETQIPLPMSNAEDETAAMYFLLALTSLRRVMVEVLDTVGYKSDNSLVIHNPAVALELKSQIENWYEHLPAILHFTKGEQNITLDARKAYLRCCYYALMIVASWPFVLRVSVTTIPARTSSSASASTSIRRDSHTTSSTTIDTPASNSNSTPNSYSQPPSDPIVTPEEQEASQTCLEACRFFLRLSEDLLLQKTVVSHLVVRQSFTFLMILLITYEGPNPNRKDSAEEKMLLESVMRNLAQFWSVVPFMRGSLEALGRIARAKGLAV